MATVDAVTARRGVVLATGGYQSNPRLRLRYQPEFLARAPYLGVDTCRGDGHLMGQAVGGDLINMTFVPPLVIVSSSVVEDAIAVNEAGERFHDEAGPYEERVERCTPNPVAGPGTSSTTSWPGEAGLIGQMPEPAVRARHPRRAGRRDRGARGVAAGHGRALERLPRQGGADADPDLRPGRAPAGPQALRNPPFTAIPMVVGVNFCCGGFRVTTSMQVIDVFGAAIPGLYAAGDCVGGLNPVSDLGGIHICGGFTLGRVAGRPPPAARRTRAPTERAGRLPAEHGRHEARAGAPAEQRLSRAVPA